MVVDPAGAVTGMAGSGTWRDPLGVEMVTDVGTECSASLTTVRSRWSMVVERSNV